MEKKKTNWERVASFKSKSSNKIYDVKINIKTGKLGCNCNGYIYHMKCWHMEKISETYGYQLPKTLKEIRAEKAKLEQEQSNLITIEAEYIPIKNPKTGEYEMVRC